MEEITDITYITDITNCMHVKRVCQDFETKKLGKDHNCILNVIYYFRLMFLNTLEEYV